MNAEKINRRSEKQELQEATRKLLETSGWSKGIPGHCEGARPGQLRAGAKVLVARVKARLRKEGRA